MALCSHSSPAFVCICYIVMNINENGRFPIVLMTLSHTNLSRALTLTAVSIIESFFPQEFSHLGELVVIDWLILTVISMVGILGKFIHYQIILGILHNAMNSISRLFYNDSLTKNGIPYISIGFESTRNHFGIHFSSDIYARNTKFFMYHRIAFSNCLCDRDCHGRKIKKIFFIIIRISGK